MKQLISLVVLLALIGCTNASSRAFSSVDLKLLSQFEEGGRPVASFRLTNRSKHPFVYTGTGGNYLPEYVYTQVRTSNGWIAGGQQYCGAGNETVTLPPGGSVVVNVPLNNWYADRAHQTVRVAIPDDSSNRIAISAPLFISSTPPK